MADHVGALQGDEARGLHEVDVHADQERDVPDRRVEDLMAEIARRRPFRLRNIGVRLAMPANHTFGSDQHRAVEIDSVAIDLRHADNDVAVMFSRERCEPIRGRTWDRLDERRDLRPVEPAIACGAHLRRDDEPGTGCRGRLAEFEQPRNVARLVEHGRFELNGGDLVHARHDRPLRQETIS